jgi:hypothetical protein
MNWRPWIHSLIAAAVSGIGTALAALVVGIDLHKALLMMAVQAAIAVGMFLQKSPLPEDRQVWTPEQRAANTKQ